MSITLHLLVGFVLSLIAAFLTEDTQDFIIKMDHSSFNRTLSEHEVVLVNFYAPWCGFCRKIEKDLQLASVALQSQNMAHIKIASVDATLPENEELMTSMALGGYPTLAVYKNGQRLTDYTGTVRHSDIATFLLFKSSATLNQVSSLSAVHLLLNKLDPDGIFGGGFIGLALAVFLSQTSDNAEVEKKLVSASLLFNPILFAQTFSEDVIRKFNVKEDTLLIFTAEYDLELPVSRLALLPSSSTEELLSAVLKHTVPAVIEYSALTQPVISMLPIKEHVLVFTGTPPIKSDGSASSLSDQDNPETMTILQLVHQAAVEFRGRFAFIHVGWRQHSIHQFFDVTSTNIPMLIIANMTSQDNMRKFAYSDFVQYHFDEEGGEAVVADEAQEEEAMQRDSSDAESVMSLSVGEYNMARIRHFLRSYLSGALSPSLKSDDGPSASDEEAYIDDKMRMHEVAARGFSEIEKRFAIDTIVGKSFRMIVTDLSKVDSFVFFHSLWCVHCKAFESVVLELSQFYRQDWLLRIGRMDAHRNEVDHPGVRIVGFPTFFFFPAGRKDQPIEYTGERSFREMVLFVEGVRRSTMKYSDNDNENEYDDRLRQTEQLEEDEHARLIQQLQLEEQDREQATRTSEHNGEDREKEYSGDGCEGNGEEDESDVPFLDAEDLADGVQYGDEDNDDSSYGNIERQDDVDGSTTNRRDAEKSDCEIARSEEACIESHGDNEVEEAAIRGESSSDSGGITEGIRNRWKLESEQLAGQNFPQQSHDAFL